MFNTRFSLFKAYLTGFKMILEYISFYMLWYTIVVILGFLLSVGLGIYLHVLDFDSVTQNFGWIKSLIMKWFVQVKLNYTLIPRDIAPYGWMEIFLPESIMNHSLATMSWSEYFNIIIWPKKNILFLVIGTIIFVTTSVSVGLIKTAFLLQSDQNVSLSDMYKYFWIVPSYLITRCMMIIIILIPMFFVFWIGYLVAAILKFTEASVVAIMVGIFLYQRLRFSKYFIVDQNLNPVKALKASWLLTQGAVFHLIVFTVCSIAIMTAHFSGIFLYFFMIFDKHVEVNVYKQLLNSKA